MTKETTTIEITRYRDNTGQPTCSISKDENCMFLTFLRLGTTPVCNVTGQVLGRRFGEGNNMTGCLIPSKKCIVWGD